MDGISQALTRNRKSLPIVEDFFSSSKAPQAAMHIWSYCDILSKDGESVFDFSHSFTLSGEVEW